MEKLSAKQEAIKKAYGVHYEEIKNHIDSNGYFEGYNIIGNVARIWNFLYGACEIGHNKIRPKELANIQNNNDWIRVESEADLPTDKTATYIMGNLNEGRFHYSKYEYTFTQAVYSLVKKTHTHYRVNKELPPPIY